MKTDIILTKLQYDGHCAEFNIKFQTTLNYEDFTISGDFWLSENEIKKLANELNKDSSSIVFYNGVNNSCELTVKTSSRGLKNINYHLISSPEQYNLLKDNFDLSLNTGYVIEPAVLDRILSRLNTFYTEPENSKISLIYQG